MNGIFKAPALNTLKAYDVNRVGQYEAVRATLYDKQTYGTAGTTQMNFFQVPVGQSSKTLEDTNMELAGTLPNPKHFLVQGIEIFAVSSLDHATLGAPAAQEQINDIIDLGRRGWLDFFIGSKSYLTDAPLAKFPPSSGFSVSAGMSDATTAGAGLNNRVAIAQFGGKPYDVAPPILLTPQQNFKVSLNWASVQAVSATVAIMVSLTGILYRQSQ